MTTQIKSQDQMFYESHRKLADVNNEFMWLIQNGITREDLEANIKRRPSLWDRFSGFLDKLPSRNPALGKVLNNGISA